MRTLKLTSASGTTSIGVNGSAGQRSFTNFHRLALATLATTSPNARINMGGGLANMIMMFVLGMMLFALGVFCVFMGLSEAPWYILLLGLPFLSIGGLLMYAMRRWDHHRLSVPPAVALNPIVSR